MPVYLRERTCSDKSTYCYTETEVAHQTFYLIQTQYTDTGPASPSTLCRVATGVLVSKSLERLKHQRVDWPSDYHGDYWKSLPQWRRISYHWIISPWHCLTITLSHHQIGLYHLDIVLPLHYLTIRFDFFSLTLSYHYIISPSDLIFSP